MNRDELLAAAELVRNAGEIIGSPYPHEDDARACLLACARLARHVRRLYDPTPVDEAFATAASAGEIVGSTYFPIVEREHDCVTLIRWSGGYHLKCGGFSVAERATRGDVRRLCDALGVTLREEP